MNKILIIVPTYNEIENISNLINNIESSVTSDLDILFVDDNSPDCTWELIENIRKTKENIFLIRRSGKNGLGAAYLEGFKYAVQKKYSYIFEMDADLSHNPAYIAPMLEKLKNFDVVIGSRFIADRNNINATPFRRFISIGAAFYVKFLLNLKCSDPMTGFVGYKYDVVDSLVARRTLSKGYAFQAEMKYKSQKMGYKLCEIPIIFKNRQLGCSKIKKRDVAELLLLPWRLRLYGI